jgi:hypothetical protein
MPDPNAAPADGFHHGTTAFSRWRRSRPFWGGLLVIFGAAVILLSERGPLPLMVHIGLQGLAGYLVPVIMLLAGLLLLFHPEQRIFYSLIAVVSSLGSWITSNLGGFFVGMLLGVVGGSLAFAWETRDMGDEASRPVEPAPRVPSPAAIEVIRRHQRETRRGWASTSRRRWTRPLRGVRVVRTIAASALIWRWRRSD